ncbi:MAG TPA: ATP-binding protein [Pelomicrobium sp.]|nr:ATP-binding protein [Pelomicrobium sp.]
MIPWLDSLRAKITVGYYLVGFLMLAVAVLALVELNLIDDQVRSGAAVTRFFDTTLEVRRFEKNAFLYHQAEDLEEHARYLEEARRLLATHRREFAALSNPDRIAALETGLARYGELVRDYGASPNGIDPSRRALEDAIRAEGKDIVSFAEELADTERALLQRHLERHRTTLVVSIGLLALLGIGAGQVVSRRVARPLREMEDSMEAVAAGRRRRLDLRSTDREIVSLSAAFDHVLAELALRQKHMVRSEKLAALGTLLSGVAHELNNPLSNISGSAQILIEEAAETDPRELQERLRQIDQQTNRARDIVRSLLDFARDRGFRAEPVSLLPLVDETIRFLKGQIPAAVALKIEVPADLKVTGDRQRLQQALLNLIKNAAEAAPAGEIRLRARAYGPQPRDAEDVAAAARFRGQCEEPPAGVDLEIADTGHGIEPALVPRIFDPFFTTKDVGHGSGLGLFIVHEVIAEHGGCIAVESQPGVGTSFHIRLPQPPRLTPAQPVVP